MIKVAFFVEGITEQYFVQKLLKEIFGQNGISIITITMSGGASCPIKKDITSTHTVNPRNEKYAALIYNCLTGSSVKSYILEERETLIKANYSKIFGLLDLHPLPRGDYQKFKKGLIYHTPTKDIEIKYILSIMEIEAWFLGEDSHFEKIDPLLKIQLIIDNLGFNPSAECMENRDYPSNDLHNCYSLVGKAYNKKIRQISRTVEALDYCYLYMDRRKILLSLNELIDEIEGIFKL